MDVAQLVRLPNGDQVVMGSTPTFHSGKVVGASKLVIVLIIKGKE